MHWKYQITVHQSANIRDFLHQQLLLPKHLIFSLRRAKRITVNHQYLNMNQNVIPGDLLEMVFEASDFKNPNPQIIPNFNHAIEILYQTNDLIVINKLAGIKTHPNQPNESGSALNIADGYLANRNETPFIINRLDMWTSGILMFGKNPAIIPPLTELIKTKQIQRTYLTWVSGNIKNNSGTINSAIGRDPHDKRKRKINGTNAASAITHYQVLSRRNNVTLLQIKLETGRTHQIRVHFASIGHPIIGDPLYNPHPGKYRLQLHSWKLHLVHPFTHRQIDITAPYPNDFM